MQRLAVLLAIVVGCSERASETPPPPIAYGAPPIAWQLGELRGRFGRGEATQLVTPLAIAGAGPALRLPTPWAIPGTVLAAVYGQEGDKSVVELVDVDAGRSLWRERVACAAPIVGVTPKAIVCADAKGIRAIGLDGKPRWKSDATFVAITDDRIVTATVGEAVIIDAETGDEVSRVKLPVGISVSTIVASCGDAGRELYAIANDRLVRIAEAAGGPRIGWSQPIDDLLAIDACDGATVIASFSHALVAFARDKGTPTGRVDGVRGFWPLGERLAVATGAGVASYARDLATQTSTSLPALGELIAKRGTRRLVRASPHSAVLLDGVKPLAYVPFAENGGVLGEHAILAATWSGSASETLHRFAIPEHWTKRLRISATPAVALPAELRDLPAPSSTGASRDSTPAKPVAFALDPDEPSALYAIAATGELARADLDRGWSWQRGDACRGEPLAVGIARERVACLSKIALRATTKSGAPAWETMLAVDAIAAAGELFVAFAADRAIVIDARDGHRLGEIASDDGAPVRAAVIARGAATWLVTAEHGRLVARAGMSPVWSLAVAGTIASIEPSGEGVLVALDDGDAYRIELATARVIALPGLGLHWLASDELVLGAAVGGPLPAPLPPPIIIKRVGPPPKPDPEAAPMSVPIEMPKSLGDSYQLTLYALHGGLRARNDYVIGGTIGQRARGAGIAVVGGGEALIVEPVRGDPVARVPLPERAIGVFTTIVAGKPVAGAVLADPLGFVLF